MAQPPKAKPPRNPPTTGKTSLCYVPCQSSHLLLASISCDGFLRIYNTSNGTRVKYRSMKAEPLLSLATPCSSSVLTGGLHGAVQKFDIERSTISMIGKHSCGRNSSNACSCLSWMDGANTNSENLVASSGWDCNLFLWDIRLSNKRAALTEKLPAKALSMDSNDGQRVVVATAGQRICLFDLRKPSLHNIESFVGSETKTVRFFPDGKGLAVCSVEGKVAMLSFDDSGFKFAKNSSHGFRLHGHGTTIYPANDIAFHPRFGEMMAIGKGDGNIIVLDTVKQYTIAPHKKFPTSIGSIAFSGDGEQLAIASNNPMFEVGERKHKKNGIFVENILLEEYEPIPELEDTIEELLEGYGC